MSNRKIAETEIVREDLQEESSKINVLEEYAELPNEYPEIKQQEGKENIVLIDDFILTKEAKMSDTVDVQSEQYNQYLTWAEANNIGTIGKIKCECSISTSFTTFEQRNEIIKEIYNKVMEKYYKGICIEFEQIDDANSFQRFLIELIPKFKESGLKVIVKLNQQMNQEKVKNIVDFTI